MRFNFLLLNRICTRKVESVRLLTNFSQGNLSKLFFNIELTQLCCAYSCFIVGMYREVEGTAIPYKQYGFGSVEEMMMSPQMRDTVSIGR